MGSSIWEIKGFCRGSKIRKEPVIVFRYSYGFFYLKLGVQGAEADLPVLFFTLK